MELLVEILTVLKDFSPLGVAAMAVAAIVFMVWKNPFKPIESRLDTISGNHLHQLPEIASNMQKAVTILERIEIRLAEDLTLVKTKLDRFD